MRLFVHQGSGHWIGSCYVVLAESRGDAEQTIRARLDASGLKREELALREVPTDAAAVVIEDDGDY